MVQFSKNIIETSNSTGTTTIMQLKNRNQDCDGRKCSFDVPEVEVKLRIVESRRSSGESAVRS